MTVSVYKFGEFALDCGRFELSRNGQPIRLERKPMELLILLAERDGQLVSREEIAERLWGEVFVDIKHGINTAVRKIRQTLRDDPADPHFVRTVTGKGYCLIAPLSAIEETGGPDFLDATRDPTACDPPSEVSMMEGVEAVERTHGHARRWIWVALTLLGAMLVGAVALGTRDWSRRENKPPRINSLAVIPLENLSRDAGQDYLVDGVTELHRTPAAVPNYALRWAGFSCPSPGAR
jgi:DNA-binding winged helix-turn-helix (wHTH) protein